MSTENLIAPTDLRDFLKSQGWQLSPDGVNDRLFVLSNSNYPRRQLIFPIDAEAPDYLESVGGVIEKFAEMTRQLPSSLVTNIKAIRDDVLRLRIFFDGNDSVLPLSYASNLVQSTEKLLKAAACTVLRPRPHHPRLALNEANQFVEKAKFGQTEQGSFILRVACPIHAMEVQGVLDFQDEQAPFVRQVTMALQSALVQLTSAIETDTLDKLVEDLKKNDSLPLISSNLCDALNGMHDDQVDNSLDVSFDWSLLRDVPREFRKKIRIQKDYFSRIEEVRRELRSVEVDLTERFIGTVERLDGEMGDDGRRSGPVVLSILLPDEGVTVRARIILSPEDYAKADKAHMTNGAYVCVKARLRPGHQPRQLTDVTSFEVLSQQ